MKKWYLLLAVLLAAASIAGCGSETPEPKESAWEVTIGEKVFAIEDIKEMESVTFDAEKKEEVNSYTGVRLSILLAEAGITDFASLTLTAADGYSYDVTKEEAEDANSILCYQMNGQDLTDEKSTPLMFVSTATSSKAWVGKLKTIQPGE